MQHRLDQIEHNSRQSAMNSHVLAINSERSARNSELMVRQMSQLLDTTTDQLEIQEQQLNVSNEIRKISQQQTGIQREQLAQAIMVVKQLDITNTNLQQLNESINDISCVLVQQNALIQKSLNRLATESQELIDRGIDAYKNGWFKDATKDMEDAIAKNPYSAIAYYFLGKCYKNQNMELESNQAYQKCMYYAQKNAPIFNSLSLCDLATYAIKEKNTSSARKLLSLAVAKDEKDKILLVSCLLECDLEDGPITPETELYTQNAFDDEAIDPEVLMQVIYQKSPLKLDQDQTLQHKKFLSTCEELTNKSLYKKLISHFYRELDDFVYLAPRVRRGFIEAAEGKFLSLGDPLAEILDWSVGIGEQLVKNIDIFPQDCPDILRLFRSLNEWNEMLIRLNRLIGILTHKSALVNGQFVSKLNLGMIELPEMHEDDTLLFEINTDEGDTLALSCYYAVFSRNGIDHFVFPLHEYSYLKIDAQATSPTTKFILVTDPRHGQKLIQGTTGHFSWSGKKNQNLYLIDSFVEIASLLSQVHECIDWAKRNEDKLYSIFVLFYSIFEKISLQRIPSGQNNQFASYATGNTTQNVDDNFDEVEDNKNVDDDFDEVEDSKNVDDGFDEVKDPAECKWFIGRNKQKHGPFSWSHICELAKIGRFEPSDFLLQEGGKDWIPVRNLIALHSKDNK